MLSIDKVDTPDDFYALGDVWNKVLQKSESDNIFLTFEWLSSWWECFGGENILLVLLVRDGEEIIAVAPLMKRRKLFLHTVEFIGTGRSDQLDFIITRKNREVLESIFEHLIKNERLSIIHLRDIPEDSPNVNLVEDVVRTLSSSFEVAVCTVSPYLSIKGTWDEYLETRSGHFRQKIRRETRKMESKAANFICYQSEMDAQRVLRMITEIEKKSWKQKAGNPRFGDEKARKFFEMVFRKFAAQGWFEACLVEIGSKSVAYSVNFTYDSKLYYYQTGFALEEAKLSPGFVLLGRVIQDAFERGINEVDFLRGDEKYKYSWTKSKRDLYQFGICNHFIPKMVHYLTNRVRWRMREHRIFHTLYQSILKCKRRLGRKG